MWTLLSPQTTSKFLTNFHHPRTCQKSQPGKGEAGKPSQPKRRREPKGKEVMETGRPRPSNEEEAHKVTKQQKTSHAHS